MTSSEDLLRNRTALILYGSETGNAHDVAEQIRDTAERLRFSSHLCELDSINLNDLLKHQVVLFAISTTGQGDLPANAQKFWRSLRSARLKPGCLYPLQFISFGLGDTSYPKFNWAHRKLRNRLTQLGAIALYDRGESDEQHPEGVDGTFVPWLTGLRSTLLELFPLPNGVDAIPDQVLLQPKWLLALDDAPESTTNRKANFLVSDLLPITGSVPVEVVSNDRVTPDDHWQDVRHLILSTDEQYEYGPGDVLAIQPQNFAEDVSRLLELLGWSSIADKSLKFIPNGSIPLPPNYPPPPIRTDSLMTLRTLLTSYLDPISIPRRTFFALLAHFTDDPDHQERLLEFADPINLDDLYDYTTRPRRSILESLADFPSLKLPWEWACAVFPPLRQRQFSIASGGQLKYLQSQGHVPAGVASTGTRFELLVAIVKYKTVIRRIREGVCTRYISSLPPGYKLNVVLQKGSLAIKPDELMQRPLIMVGPGTGVAPCRSLIWEKQALLANHNNGNSGLLKTNDVLFFGCRNERSDYFFGAEWQRMKERGVLDVFAAFSRDQRQKVYVQDLIREQGELVYKLLEECNGLIYICGSSGKMPQAIREALIEVFQRGNARSREEAEAVLVRMEKEGRYKQETW
ncbi:NADPH dependent diflavin oxidoreductase-like protein 1 [Eremomyces bilateralis CBS 781.70]|uniref:NADPH-dependent diflavin oxidoreductase 1 n=1 Tax=Eremomyces bilateralis CBS 781.70 TaxID=1392243 RepID=A0A6G1G3I1_9PEZI|nr:NADPH dependent diflavin oxidoreductase-like protein 1 [Eremomyces bilateralis CBS 781.70]KAF1812542.1 NADPH dependent diflavin oxidoreductase-like protein 1 [Eremomyces bilateralis CBS 781.70]